MSTIRLRRKIAVAALAVLLATVGLLNAGPAFAANAASGEGTMNVSPSSVAAGSTGNQLTFTFKAGGNKFANGSKVALTVPAGWTPPSTTLGTPGYTTASGLSCGPGSLSISGAGPWTITVSQTCDAGAELTLLYGAGNNPSHVTAPSTPQTATFTAASQGGQSGSLVNLTSGSPVVNVVTGPPAKLAFTTQPPPTGTAGAILAAFRVTVQDASGNTVTTSNDPITLSASGPPGGDFSSAPSTYTNVPAVSGVATFNAVALSLTGTYTLTASRSGLTSATSTSIVVSAGAAAKLAFAQGPSNGFAGTPLSPAVTVQVQDQNGNPVSAAGVAVTLTASAGLIDSGATATTNSSGLATFSGVTINSAALGLTLTASASNLTSAGPSASFNVTVAVSNGATLGGTTSDGSGSGVKSVAYYYCAGYSGACTSANWTSIGSSTVANYQISWTGQPANGVYRVVAVSTDNVSNVSQPSAATPVTVAN
ncbi:hypothetical protein [Kribbella sp. NPDC050459]|uniref:hypothetical protein n=1 Tax=Kribbella sp. NPDC050459 TaxID=3155785 RepID=UPI003400144E